MAELQQLLQDNRHGTVATIKRDGRPQLSPVSFVFADNVIRFSTTDDRAKVKNLRRDPRVSFYVPAPGYDGYIVAEGTAELSAVAADPNDDTVNALVDVYRSIAGEHPDWDEYRAAMVADKRLVVTIPVDRVYGWAR
ncbi:PPOX class F420-dependent oxidoreductase [Actinocrispum sp. NPDC049592]|uniref:PPOX class F420-dependent oxidoreductase n=1 Tax=Actinocrispum sp. NPDC049592 TaxID=3154835 RepID=UPI0034468390